MLFISVYAQTSAADEPPDEQTDGLEDEFKFLEEDEDEVVYSASKHAQDISESPSAITVITREQIENTHCTDIVCLLRQVPEVEVRRVLPMYFSVGARALAGELGDKTMVLVDGREINNELLGLVFWAGMPVHLDEIDRIEVIRGPGSALYGANAHSMVVSITTRKPDTDRAEVYFGAGEKGRSSTLLRLDRTFGEWRFSLAGSREIANHWRIQDKREREVYNLRLNLAYVGDSSTTSLDMGLVDGKGEVYNGISLSRWNRIYIAHAVLDHSRDWIKARVTFNMMYGSLEPIIRLNYNDIELGRAPDHMTYNNPSLDAELQVNQSFFKGNLLVAGSNYRWIAMYSDMNDPDQEHQHRVGLFIQDEQRLFDQLTLNLGLRLDYNSITPLTFSPRLAVVWRPVQSQLVRLAFGRAFRKPSFLDTSFHFLGFEGTAAFPELGDFFKNNIGNSDLGNESITVFETGYRGRFLDGALTAEADAFFNMYRDTIAFNTKIETTSLGVPDLTRSTMRFENNGREVNSAGGSISLVYHIKEKLRLYLNYTYRYSWFTASPTTSASTGGGAKGDRVPWESAHLANAGFYYLFDCGLRLGASAHFHSARDNTQTENGDLFGDMIVLHNPAHVIYNAFASWRLTTSWGWVEAGLRAFDVFNEGFRDSVAVQRTDGSELGGELIGRRIFLFLRGSL